jgi:hypothetical protein
MIYISIFAEQNKAMMNYFKTLLFTAATLSMAACHLGSSDEKKADAPIPQQVFLGDHVTYGLACEGCSDSVVVLLPNDGSDPVTYDIIDAKRNGKVLGNIRTGDRIGLVLDPKDKKVADMVIDLDDLKGIWCYIVMPKMRDYDKMSPRLQARMMRDMPDSLKETYLIPREYGFWLKRHGEAQSVGYVPDAGSLAGESPVVYPPLGYFTSWHIWNGKLIITRGEPSWSHDGQLTVKNPTNDTCSIDFLADDSLVLSADGVSRSYYRKHDINDVNTKAKAIANMQKKQAVKEATE